MCQTQNYPAQSISIYLGKCEQICSQTEDSYEVAASNKVSVLFLQSNNFLIILFNEQRFSGEASCKEYLTFSLAFMI